MSLQRTFARSPGHRPHTPAGRPADLGVAFCALALFMAIVHLAAYWMGTAVPSSPISENARSLPLYAFYSVMRIAIAYSLSLCFGVAYGWTSPPATSALKRG